MNYDKQVNILAIGDIAIDVFIKLKDAEEKCDPDGSNCELCLDFGSKIPYESAEVCPATGNSSNVAICLSKLGLNSSLMSNIGDDQYGVQCLDKLKEENVDTTLIKKEIGKPTNYHYVLWYKKEHTILTKHEKYEYEWNDKLNSPSWIYLSSLGENSLSFYNQIVEYLRINTNTKLVFSPGTFQIKLGAEKLKDIYKSTEVFICNHEEAQKVLNTKEEDISKLIKMISILGPKIVVITDGVKGAYSYDGNEILFMKAFTEQSAIESTGAGDSFSGAFVGALALGKNISDALMWGTVNSRSVVLFSGPHKGLLTKDQIEQYISNMSTNYKSVKIN